MTENDIPKWTLDRFKDVAIVGFDFSKTEIHAMQAQPKISFFDLLIHLWPGNWHSNLEWMNNQINADNVEAATKQ